MRAGEVLTAMIAERGVDAAFGIPGVHTIELYRGLARAPIRHVTPRHEQGAGFMADGFARASGQPALVCPITGPGLTNALTAMGQALADSVPMLVVSAVNASEDLGRGEGRLHELPDQLATSAGVARFSRRVRSTEEAAEALDDAFDLFAAARPGPVHLEIPLDAWTDRWSPPPPPRARRAPLAPDPARIADAVSLLERARAPIVILGGGVRDAAEQARALVDRLGAPVVTTINAKGVLPPGHPSSLGTLLASEPVMNAALDADVLLAIGAELGETDTLLFGKRFEPIGQVIRIDVDAAQLARNCAPAVAIRADAGLAMAALTAALGPHSRDLRAAPLRERGLASLDERHRAHGRFARAIDEALDGAVIVGDSAQPIYGANFSHDARAPRRWWNSATGYGTLGYAIPAAIGAKCALPDEPVVALIGDGGAMFTAPEIIVAAENRLGLPIVIWNNRGYGEIADHMRRVGAPPLGVDLLDPDFEALARGLRAGYARPRSGEALDAALRDAVAGDRPVVIEVEEEVGLEIGAA